ncbi:MAG: FAD-binding oxidoreductase, partial [Myxococcaceae bacterium]
IAPSGDRVQHPVSMRDLIPVDAASLPPPSDAARVFVAQMGCRASFSDQDRIGYSKDMWPKAMLWIREGKIPSPPDAVVWPADEDELVALVLLARELKVPLIPFGAGSGVCGGTWAVRGGIAVDLKRFEKVGEVDQDGFCVDAEAGVFGEILERNLNRQGFTLGHFPSSIYMSTLGGWLAARSAGQLSSRYGKIEDMALSVRAVLGTGERVSTPERPHAEMDLAPLLIGSEGTLCFFTGARLRVHPLPEGRLFRGIKFKRLEHGVEAIRKLFHAGLRPSVTRLYDPFDTALVGREKPRHKPKIAPSLKSRFEADTVPALLREVSPTALGSPKALNRAADLLRHCLLILMFEGASDRVASEEAEARAICLEAGGEDQGEQPGKDWYRKRYDVSYKMSKVVDAGAFADTMEVAATWDRVLDVYEAVREAASGLAFVMCHFSHAYAEGCSLYFSFASSASEDEGLETRYDRLWAAALPAAMRAGATVSHHHGVGLLKADALLVELGTARPLLVSLKRALDPDGILNPGKLGL